MEEKNIPGFSFILARNGKLVDEGYYGVANLELNVPVAEKSVFAIASMSKTYTASAILLLVEDKKLKLSDPVRKYIPEAPESWSAITIKQLLTHSSGLVDDWGLYSWDKSNELFLKFQTDSLILTHLFEAQLRFDPGTDTNYSSGPFVLGIVIERITGQYYGEYLKESIFEPLGLKETWVDHPYKLIPNRVSGYFVYDTTEMNSGVSGMGNGILLAPVSYGRADVGIRTTTRDLLKFYNALLTGNLLTEQSMEIMFNPGTLDNGDLIPTAPGWMYWPLAGNLIAEHSGGFRTGFSSQAFIVPKDRFVIILLTNLHGGVDFPLAQQIAANYYPEFKQLSTRVPIQDDKPEVTAQHLEYFKSLASSTVNRKLLNENYPKSYFSGKLKKSIASTEKIVFLGENNVENKNVKLFGVKIHVLRYYKLINGNREFYTTLSLDKFGRLVFMDYPETK